MPHKRSKRSVREKLRSDAGVNTAPEKTSLSKEEVPKSVARVLNAAKVQQEWRAKQKRNSEDTSPEAGPSRKKQKKNPKNEESSGDLRIKPGESLAHFNRRVENAMRGNVRTAMQTSSSVARKAKKDEEESQPAKKQSNAKLRKGKREPDDSDTEDRSETEARPIPARPSPKEFTALSTSAPRRLNDIVQAPPEIKRLPRGAKIKSQTSSLQSLKEGVMSMAQKAMLEEERERAVRLYREMKQKKIDNV